MSKISHAPRIKRLGSRLGSMVLLEFPKKWRENEKKPQNLAISGAFLGGEGEIYEQNSGGRGESLPQKRGANKAIPPSIGVSRLTGYQTDQPRQKENPTLTGRVLFLAEKERFEFREVDFNPSYPFYMFVQLRF